MAQTVNVTDADTYFSTEVLWTDEWDGADASLRDKALTNAENQLYRHYTEYDISDPDNQIVDIAIYEQALWLLRLDDSIRKAEQGVKTISVSGVTISLDRAASHIAPEVTRILGRRIGWSVL
jgi:hypothetical protein